MSVDRCRGRNLSRGLSQFSWQSRRKWDCPLQPHLREDTARQRRSGSWSARFKFSVFTASSSSSQISPLPSSFITPPSSLTADHGWIEMSKTDSRDARLFRDSLARTSVHYLTPLFKGKNWTPSMAEKKRRPACARRLVAPWGMACECFFLLRKDLTNDRITPTVAGAC
jgi:hypothetical protein